MFVEPNSRSFMRRSPNEYQSYLWPFGKAFFVLGLRVPLVTKENITPDSHSGRASKIYGNSAQWKT